MRRSTAISSLWKLPKVSDIPTNLLECQLRWQELQSLCFGPLFMHYGNEMLIFRFSKSSLSFLIFVFYQSCPVSYNEQFDFFFSSWLGFAREKVSTKHEELSKCVKSVLRGNSRREKSEFQARSTIMIKFGKVFTSNLFINAEKIGCSQK